MVQSLLEPHFIQWEFCDAVKLKSSPHRSLPKNYSSIRLNEHQFLSLTVDF